MEGVPENLDVMCMGGAVVDRTYRLHAPAINGTSNPSSAQRSFGGVARNVTENLARLRRSAGLVSLVGNDEAGQAILDQLAGLGVDVSGCTQHADVATAEYVAVMQPSGTLQMGLAAMDAFETISPAMMLAVLPALQTATWVFADTNPPAETLAELMAGKQGFKLAVDCVSVPKAARLPDDLGAVDLLFANLDEARALVGRDAAPEDIASALLNKGAASVVLTLGAEGHVVADRTRVTKVPAVPCTCLDVTGAGDALIAGTLHGLLQNLPLVEASRMGAGLAA
ncbi:MAG: PfkB family carbohydrate kinase, partial [Devosiaceae bacterium]